MLYEVITIGVLYALLNVVLQFPAREPLGTLNVSGLVFFLGPNIQQDKVFSCRKSVGKQLCGNMRRLRYCFTLDLLLAFYVAPASYNFV